MTLGGHSSHRRMYVFRVNSPSASSVCFALFPPSAVLVYIYSSSVAASKNGGFLFSSFLFFFFFFSSLSLRALSILVQLWQQQHTLLQVRRTFCQGDVTTSSSQGSLTLQNITSRQVARLFSFPLHLKKKKKPHPCPLQVSHYHYFSSFLPFGNIGTILYIPSLSYTSIYTTLPMYFPPQPRHTSHPALRGYGPYAYIYQYNIQLEKEVMICRYLRSIYIYLELMMLWSIYIHNSVANSTKCLSPPPVVYIYRYIQSSIGNPCLRHLSVVVGHEPAQYWAGLSLWVNIYMYIQTTYIPHTTR